MNTIEQSRISAAVTKVLESAEHSSTRELLVIALSHLVLLQEDVEDVKALLKTLSNDSKGV